MTLRWPDKDPGDLLDYSIDFANEIDPGGATSDTVSTVVWTVPAPLTLSSQSETGTVAVAWLDGGTAGSEYSVHVHMTSAQAREVDRDILIKVRDL